MKYNPGFAKVYHMHWAGFANRPAPRIREFYERTPIGQANKTALDVCCGTGQLALHLLEHGYTVTELDFSPAMLSYALEKARQHITVIYYGNVLMKSVNEFNELPL